MQHFSNRVQLGDTKVGIWLISLPESTARRAAMERQLASLGLAWRHFKAINGAAERDRLLAGADEAAYQRNMGSTLLPGKLGVYASHLAVWEELLASDNEFALILEDDVVFHEDFPQALDAALAGREQWDLLRFNAVRAKIPVTQTRLGDYRLNAYVGPFTGNACYLIKREAAARLLPRLRPQRRAFDHELNRFFEHDYRLRGLEPFASHTDDGQVSTITGQAFERVRKFKWHRRLPYYRQKAANYLRRLAYLARNGAVPGKARRGS
jgi:glycosyl transferase, family 25